MEKIKLEDMLAEVVKKQLANQGFEYEVWEYSSMSSDYDIPNCTRPAFSISKSGSDVEAILIMKEPSFKVENEGNLELKIDSLGECKLVSALLYYINEEILEQGVYGILKFGEEYRKRLQSLIEQGFEEGSISYLITDDLALSHFIEKKVSSFYEIGKSMEELLEVSKAR